MPGGNESDKKKSGFSFTGMVKGMVRRFVYDSSPGGANYFDEDGENDSPPATKIDPRTGKPYTPGVVQNQPNTQAHKDDQPDEAKAAKAADGSPSAARDTKADGTQLAEAAAAYQQAAPFVSAHNHVPTALPADNKNRLV